MEFSEVYLKKDTCLDLTLEEFFILVSIIEGLIIIDETKLQDFYKLEELGYIKILPDNKLILREKSIKLFPKTKENSYNVTFEMFWDKYHNITGKYKSDKDAAERYWKGSRQSRGLTPEEKEKAYNNIQFYFDSVNDKMYVKKARTYLSDKNFNDEFKDNSIEYDTIN